MIYLIMKKNELWPFLYKMSKKLGILSTKLKLCAFTSLKDDSNADTDPSDDIIEKELEIKLDITKKSRRINRPVQFADQHGMMDSADIFHPIFPGQVRSWRRCGQTPSFRPSTSPGTPCPGSSSAPPSSLRMR